METTTSIDIQPNVNLELEQLEADLGDARSVWAEMTARRQGRVRDWRIRGYNAAEERYKQLSIEYAQKQHAEQLQHAATVTERNQVAIQAYIDESKRLAQEIDAIAEGGRLRKVVRGIGKAMASGGRVAEIVKGGVVVAGARALGGTALAFLTSAGIGYAKHESMRDTSRQEVRIDTEEVETASGSDYRAVLEAVYAAGNEKYEQKTLELQGGVRRSVKHGLAVAATSFVVGNLLHSVASNFFAGEAAHAAPTENATHGVPGLTAETADPTTGHTTPGFATEVQPADPTSGHTTPGFAEDTTNPTDSHTIPDTVANPETETPEVSIDSPAPESASEVVGNISADEGFYSVFGEMGVDPGRHAELMQEIGPQLKDMGVAYEAATDVKLPNSDLMGTIYGWNMTGDLPPEANELILNTAREHGWMTDAGGVDASSVVDVAPSGGGVIESGEGFYSEFGQHAAEGMSAQDVPVGLNAEVMAHVGPELVNQEVAYDAGTGENGNTVYGWSHTGDVSDATHKTIQDAIEKAHADVAGQADTFSDKDWSAIEAMLQEARADGNMDGFSMQNPALLNAIGPEIQGYQYPDGTRVAVIGENGNWVINDNKGLMPEAALQKIHEVLDTIDGMHADDVAYMNVRR